MMIFHKIILVCCTINYLWTVFYLIQIILLGYERYFNFIVRFFIIYFLNMLLSATLVFGAWGLYVYFNKYIGMTILKQLLTTCS